MFILYEIMRTAEVWADMQNSIILVTGIYAFVHSNLIKHAQTLLDLARLAQLVYLSELQG